MGDSVDDCSSIMLLLYLLFLAYPLIAFAKHEDAENVEPPCAPGWLQGPPGMGCLLMQTEALTWVDAAASCWRNYQGAHLVEIKNEEQQEFLRTTVSEFPDNRVYGWWIGATDLNREGSWYWAHSLEPMDYSDWYPGEPNNQHENENCAIIYGLAVAGWMPFWDDYHCSNSTYQGPSSQTWGSLYSICQKFPE